MTAKARELGMANTTYVNASGLPADEQITTARDQALLASAIQHRFPIYYRYFATPSFVYHGAEMRNHNMLLGNVKGVDGIKTGYTEASGYNLVSSVRRDNKHLIAVVLGGTSNAARDARMRQLIEDHINLCAVGAATPADANAPAPAAPHAVAVAPAQSLSKPNVAHAKAVAAPKANLAPAQTGRPPAQAAVTQGTPAQAKRAPAAKGVQAATVKPPQIAAAKPQPQAAATKTAQPQAKRDPLKASAAALSGRRSPPAPAMSYQE
jgi:D-alanyl-D-alanine carboxypeptidase